MKIISELGSGKSGTVYKALYDGEEVAVKSILPITSSSYKKDELDKISEIAVLIKLLPICVPYAVCMLDAFMKEGWLYIITDFINGYDHISFQSCDFSDKPLKELVKGLHAIHKIGIAHRDIHGGNIMYDKDYDMYRYIDFGVATPNPTEFDYQKDIKNLANLIKEYYLYFRDMKRVYGVSNCVNEEIYINKDKVIEFTDLMVKDFEKAYEMVDTIRVNERS